MKIPALICVLSATALATVTQAADVSVASRASSSERWIQNYYQNPRADDLLTAVHSLSRTGELSAEKNVATNIGFFAAVFEQNPQKVNYWLRETASLPEADRRVLAAAAWQAGSPRGAALLRDMSQRSTNEVRQEIAGLLERGATPVAETAVLSESSMNLHWGAFLASGDDRHVLAVLNAFGSGERNLSSSARFSLAQNAARHDRVMQVVRAQLDKQPEPLREELRAALNAASNTSNGT